MDSREVRLEKASTPKANAFPKTSIVNRLGKYQLVAEIARGGMGIVYLAVAQGPARFSKLLVVKELKPELSEDPSFLEMFLEEARLAARLNHPNIVQTYEIGSEGNRHFIVMDYLDGVPLARVIRRKVPNFTLGMHLRVICDALGGLHHAHTLKDFDGSPFGMVHRDMSPQNIFITFDGQAKLVDFGIAKALDSTVETRTGILKGKPAYMAPEQIGGDIDPRADIFSVGVMIWEAVARQRMWAKKGEVEMLALLLKGETPNLKEVMPDAPEALVAICAKCLAKDPEDRFPSALALQEALEQYMIDAGLNEPMRNVAQVVGEFFAKEREQRTAMIETHLAQLKAGAESGKLPSLHPSRDDVMMTPIEGDQFSLSAGALPQIGTGITQLEKISRATRKRSPLLVVLAVLLGLAAAGLAGVLVFKRAHDKSIAAVATAGIGVDKPVDPTSPSNTTAPPEGATAKTDEAAPTASGAPSAAPPSKGPVAAVAPPHRHFMPAPAPPPPPKAPPTNTDPKGTDDSTRDTSRASLGYLTIDTYPWTHVSAGGRALGDTPLVRAPLPAGNYTIQLDNPNENVHQSVTVTIKPGETVSRRLAF